MCYQPVNTEYCRDPSGTVACLSMPKPKVQNLCALLDQSWEAVDKGQAVCPKSRVETGEKDVEGLPQSCAVCKGEKGREDIC